MCTNASEKEAVSTSMNLVLLLGAASAAAAHSNTSFVIVYLDDFGFGDASAFGNPMVQSPSIDRLVVEGMKATSFYVAAPICSSSRSSLLT
jgi:arylsulfatase A-like enzyme